MKRKNNRSGHNCANNKPEYLVKAIFFTCLILMVGMKGGISAPGDTEWILQLPWAAEPGFERKDGTIFVSGGDSIGEFTSEGRLVWQKPVPSPRADMGVLNALSDGRGGAYLFNGGMVYNFSATGEPVWFRDLTQFSPVANPSASLGNKKELSSPFSQKFWPQVPDFHYPVTMNGWFQGEGGVRNLLAVSPSGFQLSGSPAGTFLSSDGTVISQLSDENLHSINFLGLDDQDNFFFVAGIKDSGLSGLFMYNPRTDSLKEIVLTGDVDLDRNRIHGSLISHDGILYISGSDISPFVLAYDYGNDTTVWVRRMGSSRQVTLHGCSTGQSLYLSPDPQLFLSLNRETGEDLWSENFSTSLKVMMTTPGDIYVFSGESDQRKVTKLTGDGFPFSSHCWAVLTGTTDKTRNFFRPSDPPDAPGNLMAETTHQGIRLHWDSVSGAAGYHILRAGSLDFSNAKIISRLNNFKGTDFLDHSTEPGKEYFYRIQSYNSAGVSESVPSVPVRAIRQDHESGDILYSLRRGLDGEEVMPAFWPDGKAVVFEPFVGLKVIDGYGGVKAILPINLSRVHQILTSGDNKRFAILHGQQQNHEDLLLSQFVYDGSIIPDSETRKMPGGTVLAILDNGDYIIEHQRSGPVFLVDAITRWSPDHGVVWSQDARNSAIASGGIILAESNLSIIAIDMESGKILGNNRLPGLNGFSEIVPLHGNFVLIDKPGDKLFHLNGDIASDVQFSDNHRVDLQLFQLSSGELNLIRNDSSSPHGSLQIRVNPTTGIQDEFELPQSPDGNWLRVLDRWNDPDIKNLARTNQSIQINGEPIYTKTEGILDYVSRITSDRILMKDLADDYDIMFSGTLPPDRTRRPMIWNPGWGVETVETKGLPQEVVMSDQFSVLPPYAVILKWAGGRNCSVFEVQRSSSEQFNDDVHTFKAAFTTQYIDTDVPDGGDWYYRVRGRNDTGTGEWSNFIKISVSADGRVAGTLMENLRFSGTDFVRLPDGRFISRYDKLVTISEPFGDPITITVLEDPFRVIQGFDDLIYLVEREKVHAYSVRSGEIPEHLWTQSFPTFSGVALPAIGGGIIAGDPSIILKMDSEGEIVHSLNLNGESGVTFLQRPDGSVFVRTDNSAGFINADFELSWMKPYPDDQRPNSTAILDETGRMWHLSRSGLVTTSPDGSVEVSQVNTDRVPEILVINEQNEIYGSAWNSIIFMGSASVQPWAVDFNERVHGPAVSDDGQVVVFEFGGKVHNYDRDGNHVWTADLGTPIQSQPQVTSDGFAFLPLQGRTALLDLKSSFSGASFNRVGANFNMDQTLLDKAPEPELKDPNLKVAVRDENAIDLTWESNPTAVGYAVLRSLSPDLSMAEVLQDSVSGNSYADVEFPHGSILYYWIEVKYQDGASQIYAAQNNVEIPPLKPGDLELGVSVNTDQSNLPRLNAIQLLSDGRILARTSSSLWTMDENFNFLNQTESELNLNWSQEIFELPSGLLIGVDRPAPVAPSRVIEINSEMEVSTIFEAPRGFEIQYAFPIAGGKIMIVMAGLLEADNFNGAKSDHYSFLLLDSDWRQIWSRDFSPDVNPVCLDPLGLYFRENSLNGSPIYRIDQSGNISVIPNLSGRFHADSAGYFYYYTNIKSGLITRRTLPGLSFDSSFLAARQVQDFSGISLDSAIIFRELGNDSVRFHTRISGDSFEVIHNASISGNIQLQTGYTTPDGSLFYINRQDGSISMYDTQGETVFSRSYSLDGRLLRNIQTCLVHRNGSLYLLAVPGLLKIKTHIGNSDYHGWNIYHSDARNNFPVVPVLVYPEIHMKPDLDGGWKMDVQAHAGSLYGQLTELDLYINGTHIPSGTYQAIVPGGEEIICRVLASFEGLTNPVEVERRISIPAFSAELDYSPDSGAFQIVGTFDTRSGYDLIVDKSPDLDDWDQESLLFVPSESTGYSTFSGVGSNASEQQSFWRFRVGKSEEPVQLPIPVSAQP